MLSANSSISRAKDARKSASKFGYSFGSGSMTSMSRTLSHWNAKFVTSDFDRGSASIRSICCAYTLGSLKRLLSASVEQLFVGTLAPNEEREPRRELDVA